MNTSFNAFNGETITVNSNICFIINARTGSSSIRALPAKGTVLEIKNEKAKVKINEIESNYQYKVGEVVNVYFTKIISTYS